MTLARILVWLAWGHVIVFNPVVGAAYLLWNPTDEPPFVLWLSIYAIWITALAHLSAARADRRIAEKEAEEEVEEHEEELHEGEVVR